MKRRPKKAPDACWVSWCRTCGAQLVPAKTERKALTGHGGQTVCDATPACGKEPIGAELYVLDRIAMKLLDEERAKVAALQIALDAAKASRERLLGVARERMHDGRDE